MSRRIWARLSFDRIEKRWAIVYHDQHSTLGTYDGAGRFADLAEAFDEAARTVTLNRVHRGDEVARAAWERFAAAYKARCRSKAGS